MYASVNQWSYGGGMSALACLQAAHKQGFQGFEPAFAKTGSLSIESFQKEAKQLRSCAQDLSMTLPSLASGVYWEMPYSSPDAAIRKLAMDATRKQIDCAVALGVPSILVVPGTVGKGFFGTGATYRQAYDRALEALLALAPYARQAGVVIGIENVWNNFLLSPLEMRDLLDQIDSPFVKCYLDVGNLVPYGEGADWIDTLSHRIACIHVKDFRKSIGNLSGFVPLLEGDVDWKAVMQALARVGFTGALTAEMGTVVHDPLFAAEQASKALQIILSL